MKRSRGLLATLALLTAILISILSADGVFAAYTTCRSDPTVTLSNGAQISLVDAVADDPSDIQSINFELHIPAGFTVTDVTYDSVYGRLETFGWVADQLPGSYRDVTVVTTNENVVQVQATATMTGLLCSLMPKWQNGWSGQNIVVAYVC